MSNINKVHSTMNKIYIYTVKRNIRILRKIGKKKVDERTFILLMILSVSIPVILNFFVDLTLKTTLVLAITYLGCVLYTPTILYEIKIERFENNIPKALYTMILVLESGRSLVEAMDEVIRSGVKEVDVVFAKVMRLMINQKMGFEDAMLVVANSLDSKIFRQLVRLLIENRKYGGDLVNTLKILAKTLEDFQNLRRQLLSVTANGLAVGLVILCGVIPATAALIGGYLIIISKIAPKIPPVSPDQIAKCVEIIQTGTGIFGLLFAVPLYGFKFGRMILMCAICMTMGIVAFYGTLKLTGFILS
ncbi:type II secretion system F family protein [Methanotorris formicicus]|uniref:Type II secretion system F domain protein n=1 Tax=Methanotorris formicicus Mc-S-70 TaxID=647171 RepID=H1KYE0_9EURY|nr:type II secretion system F family protein [Methanotorris formicicus]EHP87224.1 Type II secretion system F domain protein [Methanotorris formicicus Mc-S-70]